LIEKQRHFYHRTSDQLGWLAAALSRIAAQTGVSFNNL
jgi:hypothetical protein